MPHSWGSFLFLSGTNKNMKPIFITPISTYKSLARCVQYQQCPKMLFNCSEITSVYFFILKCISQMVLGFLNISQVGKFVGRQVKRVHSCFRPKKIFFEKQIQNLRTPHETVKMCSMLFSLKAGVYGQQSRLQQTSLCEILDLKGVWLCQFSSQECSTPPNLLAGPFPCI